MSRYSILFVKKYNHIFLREERRPLLWEFKQSLGKNKKEILKEINEEIFIIGKTIKNIRNGQNCKII